MRRIDVGPRPTSRSGLAEWYADVLAAQSASGLSVAKCAHEVGVAVPTLYQWRRRLGPAPGKWSPAKLVEVTVRPADPTTEGLLVRIGDGRRSVVVPRGFDGGDLRRLLEVLESC